VTEPEVVLDLFPGDCLEIALVKTEEGAQVGRIGGGRVGCQPSLDGQMLQKTVELFKRGTDKLNPGKWSRPDLASRASRNKKRKTLLRQRLGRRRKQIWVR
jgi:hypothetical protein